MKPWVKKLFVRGGLPLLAGLIGVFLFTSCRSLAGLFPETRTWSSEGNQKAAATVRLLAVSAEKAGGWAFLEQEVSSLLPLIFWEWGYYFPSGGGKADYAADVRVREREYTLGWQTKRSLALEVRIWPDLGEDPGLYKGTPLTAAQILSPGNRSFSSSWDLNWMLRAVVAQAVGALHPLEDRAAAAEERR